MEKIKKTQLEKFYDTQDKIAELEYKLKRADGLITYLKIVIIFILCLHLIN